MNELHNTFRAVMDAKEWMDKANCRNMDVELFFPVDGHNLDPFVREVCNECPVLDECLWYANETHSDHGYFAGMNYKSRMAWRKKNRVHLGMSKEQWMRSQGVSS